MSWSIGYDAKWKRDIGYGVPAFCDYPGCNEEIDRGLAHVCGGEPYGGEHGCGLYFCGKHLSLQYVGIIRPKRDKNLAASVCERCAKDAPPFNPSREHPDWIRHKLADPSWERWRYLNPEAAALLSKQL